MIFLDFIWFTMCQILEMILLLQVSRMSSLASTLFAWFWSLAEQRIPVHIETFLETTYDTVRQFTGERLLYPLHSYPRFTRFKRILEVTIIPKLYDLFLD